MAKPTYQNLIDRTALTALAHYRTLTTYKSLKAELAEQYDTFFRAHGRPDGAFHRDNDDFLPVMRFTEAQFARVDRAKKNEYNARRRHLTAVRALACFPQEVV
jgi:hypothetical protein